MGNPCVTQGSVIYICERETHGRRFYRYDSTANKCLAQVGSPVFAVRPTRILTPSEFNDNASCLTHYIDYLLYEELSVHAASLVGNRKARPYCIFIVFGSQGPITAQQIEMGCSGSTNRVEEST